MPAVGEVEPHNFVARFQCRKINRHIGLRAGMRLDVGMLTAKQFF